MGSPKPQLYYWDIRGLAEPIRLLLNYVQLDFTDHRYPLGDPAAGLEELTKSWTSEKQSHGLDFPNIPFYVDEDAKITQSLAILQHLGRKHNLYGDTLQEAATIDNVAQMLKDFQWQSWMVYNHENFHQIKEEWKATIPGRFTEITKFLEGKDFVLGNKISFVDFLLYEMIEWFRAFGPDIFEEHPDLETVNNFQKRIEALPSIKEYMESGRFKDWPFFAPFVYFGWSKDPDFKPLTFPVRNWMAKYPLDK